MTRTERGGLTQGAATPFFVFCFFLVFCAMLRFGTRAVVGTGVGAAAVYLVLAVSQQTIRNGVVEITKRKR